MALWHHPDMCPPSRHAESMELFLESWLGLEREQAKQAQAWHRGDDRRSRSEEEAQAARHELVDL